MKIAIITPARPGSLHGNRNTAARWADLLRDCGYAVRVHVTWDGTPADAMIALHARRSHDSIKRYAAAFPARPIVLVLTGTDLYRDIRSDRKARESMRIATRMVVLQEMGLRELSPELRKKTRVIYQSARAARPPGPLKHCFEVVVSGHLREVKDPFRAAAALVHLPAASRIRVTHIGAAMTPGMARAARAWMAREPRYRWRGSEAHWKALKTLARARLMVISSLMEGGANIVCEAIAAGIPVIASRVSGNVGMLGRDYSGYFPAGDDRTLGRLLWRAESDPAYYRRLKTQCARRRTLVKPRTERENLKRLLAELNYPSSLSDLSSRQTAKAKPPEI